MVIANIQMKKYNGVAWDIINPKTTLENIKDMSTWEDIAKRIGTVDSPAKMPIGLLPDTAVHGMHYTGSFSTFAEFLGSDGDYETIADGTREYRGLKEGNYMIADTAFDAAFDNVTNVGTGLNEGKKFQIRYRGQRYGGVGSPDKTLSIRPGDWFVIDSVYTNTVFMSFIDNNTTDLYKPINWTPVRSTITYSETSTSPSEEAVYYALVGKSNTGHDHTKSDITDFSHAHTITDVTNLEDELDRAGSPVINGTIASKYETTGVVVLHIV
jgi:hypothetical protein